MHYITLHYLYLSFESSEAGVFRMATFNSARFSCFGIKPSEGLEMELSFHRIATLNMYPCFENLLTFEMFSCVPKTMASEPTEG